METKICAKCKQEKPFSDYHKQLAKKDGITSYCKPCAIESAKHSYRNRPNKRTNQMVYDKSARKKLRDIVRQIKGKYGCALCNEKDGCCLDFHHPNDDKDINVANLVNLKTKPRIFSELNKCIVLCANCHRKVHQYKIDVSKIPLCYEKLEDYYNAVGMKWYFKD